MADQVRHHRTGRIDALVLAQEADARNAEAVNLPLLLGGDLALQPDEALARVQPLAHLGGVEIGQRAGQQLDRLVAIDEPPRLAEQRRCLHVGRKDQPVAVEDVGPRGRGRVLRGALAGLVALGGDAEQHQLAGDDAVDQDEGDDGEADARPRLDVAIDVLAVQQRADQPSPPGLGRRSLRRVGHLGTHRAGSGGVIELVRSGSAASIIVPIGSGSFGLMKLGGRSGRLFRLSYCVASMKRSLVWRSASPCRRPGVSSLAQSECSARDRVALAADVGAQLHHAFGAHGRFHLDAVDVGRGEHQRADHEEVDDAHASVAPSHDVVERRQPEPSAFAPMRRRIGPLGGAQLGRTRARVGGDLLLVGDQRALGQHLEACGRVTDFRLMPRAAAGALRGRRGRS